MSELILIAIVILVTFCLLIAGAVAYIREAPTPAERAERVQRLADGVARQMRLARERRMAEDISTMSFIAQSEQIRRNLSRPWDESTKR